MEVELTMRFAFLHVCQQLKNDAPICRKLLVMAALVLVWWLVLRVVCVRRTHECILDYFGRLEFLDRCCTLKLMLSASLQLELDVTLMILVSFFSSLLFWPRVLNLVATVHSNREFTRSFMQKTDKCYSFRLIIPRSKFQWELRQMLFHID